MMSIWTRDTLVTISIALSYLCFVFSKVYIAVIAPALQYDDDRLDYDVEKHSQLLVACGLTYGFSKLVNGALVDAFNPKYCYSIFISISAICTLSLSFVHKVIPNDQDQISKHYFILAVAIVNTYAQAGGWPALSKYIYYTFSPKDYGKLFSCLSIGSRLGSILVSIIVGTSLTHLNWQGAVRIVATITILGLPLIWVSDSMRMRPLWVSIHEQECEIRHHHHTKHKHSNSYVQKCCAKTRLYCSWWCDRHFVFSMLSFALLGLLASFELFLPLFLKETVNPPSSATAFMTAVLPFGVGTSIVFGSLFLEICPQTIRNGAVLVMLFLLFLCTVCIVFFTISTSSGGYSDEIMAQTTLLLLLFSYGLFLGYPYYVPPSLYALQYGGEDAAMVMSMVDTITAVFSAVFASYGAKLASENWVLPVMILAFCSMCAFWLQFINYFGSKNNTTRGNGMKYTKLATSAGAPIYLAGRRASNWKPMTI